MEGLVDCGKVKHIGISNFSLQQVEKLLEVSRIKPVVNQIELHPLLAQRKLVGTCLRKARSALTAPLNSYRPCSPQAHLYNAAPSAVFLAKCR